MKKVFAMLLALSLLVGILPASAFAAVDTGKAIQLVENGTAANISGGGTNDYIYFGKWNNNPIKWRVLSIDGSGDTYKDAAGNAYRGSPLFLLSDALLGTENFGNVYFDKTSPNSNAWLGSDAQAWCKDFAGEFDAARNVTDAFTNAERATILATTKKDEKFTTSSAFRVTFSESPDILGGDRVFFLSAAEAENTDYGFVNNAARAASYGNSTAAWWLRSPSLNNYDMSGIISDHGRVTLSKVNIGWAARPAFNLDLEKVLFTSVVKGGLISSGGGDDNNIFPILTAETNEWKLTIRDDDHAGFRARRASGSNAPVQPGETITIEYSGARVGDNENVSAILADKDGNALYYGRRVNIFENSRVSGTFSITLAEDLPAGSYTLKVFNEQCNDMYETDYASDFVNIPLTIPSLSAIDIPQTGDDSHLALWLTMSMLSLLGIVLLRRKCAQ